MARLVSLVGTLLIFALAYGAFVQAAPVAGLIGLPEMKLVAQLGLTLVVLGIADAVAGRLFVKIHPPT
ncbi:hypothetical protein IP69_10490 [Bosea sp. AAP35]|uniref:hypothetical protein n=1 Tax=Bosea sp. AAP35 TaxID=1523417 RepID=UPI0006B94457|nr:hypothetical protein [Bosea sp. AAP35]KPF69756.1 hypothetical protein IP69_10490 [Bosea sp. AAP35]